MRYVKKLLMCLIISNTFFCKGQVSIYEIGDSITDCEVNIKNLLKNWSPTKVVNADEYVFLEWSFVETLNDSSRYVYYRNYFSGIEPVGCSVRRKSGEGSNMNRY